MEVLPPVAKKFLWLGAIFMNASSRLQIISSQGKTFCAFQKVHLIVTKNDGYRQLYSLEAAVKAADPRH